MQFYIFLLLVQVASVKLMKHDYVQKGTNLQHC